MDGRVRVGVIERLDREHEADVETALGKDASPVLRHVFRSKVRSSVHDVYGLNGLLGRPEETGRLHER